MHIDNVKKNVFTGLTYLSVVVIVSAFTLGYAALFDLYYQVFVQLFPWQIAVAGAVLFPLLFDAAELSAATLVFYSKLCGYNSRKAWYGVVGFTALGIVMNILHIHHAYMEARIDFYSSLLAGFITSLFPLSVMVVTQLLKSGIELYIDEETIMAQVVNFQDELAKTKASLLVAKEELSAIVSSIYERKDELEQIKVEAEAYQSILVEKENLSLHDQVKLGYTTGEFEGKSISQVVKELGCSRQTVMNARRELKDMGVLANGNGKH